MGAWCAVALCRMLSMKCCSGDGGCRFSSNSSRSSIDFCSAIGPSRYGGVPTAAAGDLPPAAAAAAAAAALLLLLLLLLRPDRNVERLPESRIRTPKDVCWAYLQSDRNLRGPHVARQQQQLSIDICCPHPNLAANLPTYCNLNDC